MDRFPIAKVSVVSAPDGPDTPAYESRIRVRPTQQGAVYLWTLGAFTTTLWLLGENLVFLLGAFGLGCGGVAWFLARRNLAGVTLERHLPARTRVGLPTNLIWMARRAARRAALGLEVEDRPPRTARSTRLTLEFPYVAAGEPSRCETTVVFARRGWVDLGRGAAELSSRYPLGLFRASRPVQCPGRLLVRPREGRAGPRLRARLCGPRRQEARQRRVQRGEDVVFGVREYRLGDDPRRVHWRSTARRGALVVSEWRAEQGREAIVVLGRGAGAGRVAAQTFERAVSVAATVWRVGAREGVRARLLLGGARDVVLGEGGRGLESGLDALSCVRAQGTRRPRVALRRLASAGGARTVLYVAAGPEKGLERELAAAAGAGGSWVVLRADAPSLTPWVRGLQT